MCSDIGDQGAHLWGVAEFDGGLPLASILGPNPVIWASGRKFCANINAPADGCGWVKPISVAGTDSLTTATK